MAGTLTISQLSDGVNSTSSTNCIQGSARAWVNFDGTVATPSTIRGSYNVTSITKNGTGDYTINFTNALPNANYAPNINVVHSTGTSYTAEGNISSSAGAMATTSLRITTWLGGSAAVANDYSIVAVTVHSA